ncbi:DUF3738 domain-containing protein [Chitinophaga pendula]|uniref:DUF3738 domain-containing protein n=1 Tax=Chitinophaga TaxID=79328 RepID=UPI000BAECDC5|nr:MULTISPECIES: DUF3738 domain-containing protein [Chitinophaga]ASZ11612.1 hypothetical protein CK934_11895 [Chitinophaga sp. MD30]UCJ05378.1 DUF3738 domain-containing protein [Chitinophaga pendula]
MKIFFLIVVCFCSIGLYAQDTTRTPSVVKAISLMDSRQPLLKEYNGTYLSSLLYYSYFLKHVQVEGGLVSYNRDSITGKRIGVRIVNLPLMNIIENAYRIEEIGPFQLNRIVVEKKEIINDLLPLESMNIDDPLYRKWIVDHTWCYDLRIPMSQSDNISKIMQQDIERYFRLRGTYEERKVKCLVLTRAGATDRLKTLDTARAPSVEVGESLLVIKNGSIEDFVQVFKRVNNTYLPPIIDETGYKGRIDLQLLSPLDDLDKIKTELGKYGLVLQEKERQLKMLVVRETARL